MPSAGLAEIVLIAPDVERSARFYREPGVAQRVALHDGPLLFEEYSPLPEGSRWGRVHYGFEVPREKLGEAVERIRNSCVEVHGPIRLDWMRASACCFFDPDGNLREFWSPDPTKGEATHES